MNKAIQRAAALILVDCDLHDVPRPERIMVTIPASDGGDLPVLVGDEDRKAAEGLVADPAWWAKVSGAPS